MCGICGQYNFQNEIVDPDTIVGMMDTLVHRGPDDSGMYCSRAIGLGHRRLSILDLSAKGRQPIWSNDRSMCIVFNGEVYNYRHIRSDLVSRGYRFESDTDTEAVVNAIHCYGMETAIGKFIGMFAFAVWDKRADTLYLCRDRAGIKPLYYYFNGKQLIFGSELKAILANPAFDKDLDLAALGQFFVTGYFLDTHTVFKDTYKLSPGCYITIDGKGRTRISRYWELDKFKRNNWDSNLKDTTARLEELLIDSFKYRLISDVPVGLFLSGGIDSSLVSALLKTKLKTDLLNITIGFSEDAFNEAPKAQRVSEQLGVKHISHNIDPLEAQETLLKLPDIYDEPFGDTSCIPTYILSRIARKYVKVVLSADGGDEQFCGYESYLSYTKQYRQLNIVPILIRQFVAGIFQKFVPYDKVLSMALSLSSGTQLRPQLIARFEKMLELFKIDTLSDLLRLMNEKAWTQDTVHSLLPIENKNIFKNTLLSDSIPADVSVDIIDRMMRNDYQMFLRDDILTKVDRASMAVSLECRDPMLDHRIAELAFRLPLNYLFNKGEHKYILKQILRNYISDEIVRSPKRGFMIPLYSWLRNAWKPIVMEYLSSHRIKSVGVLEHKQVAKEVDRFYKYEGCRAEKIWMMLNFQMWAEKWYLN